jgi:hypothetical protein
MTSRRLFAGILMMACVAVGSAQGGDAITNEDVIKMVRAGLSSSIILSTIDSAKTTKFDLTPDGLVSLKNAGIDDRLIEAMQAKIRSANAVAAPDKSDTLAGAKDSDTILRNFRTMFVDASQANFFKSDQMKAALGKAKDFNSLKITVVDDRSLADVVLNVGYTFAWDFPFTLKHQNTSIVLASGKGTGPFSGPKGAESVAAELVKLLKPYRVPVTTKKKTA